MRVAALADVHGNAPALAAVLEEVERERPDLVVFCGDLTWGSLPQETLALVRALAIPARFVRGNADRMRRQSRLEGRGPWMTQQHTPEDLRVPRRIRADGARRGRRPRLTCFCHGSPRSDEECVTERTPAERVREFMDGVDASAVVTAHVHVSYDRVVDGSGRSGPGSVGLPYESGAGARTGRSSAPTSSSGAPTTTSRRQWRSCARRTIRGSS